MPAYICITVFGSFLLDKDSNVLAETLVYPDTELAVHQLADIAQDETPTGLRELSTRFGDSGIEELIVDSRPLKIMLTGQTDMDRRYSVIEG